MYADRPRPRRLSEQATALLFFGALAVLGIAALRFIEGKPQTIPRPTPEIAAQTPSISDAAFADDVRFSQKQAVDTYPELAVAGSGLNRRFIARLSEWRSQNDPRLLAVDWPERLADDCIRNP